MRPSVWATPVLVLAIGASLWYVLAPPGTAGDYRERASLTAETLRSQVQTARIWVRELGEGNATRRAATVAFREAEADAVAAGSEFGRWDPAVGTVGLRSDVTRLAGDVVSALAELRIAAENERWDALARLARPLPGLAHELEQLARRADP